MAARAGRYYVGGLPADRRGAGVLVARLGAAGSILGCNERNGSHAGPGEFFREADNNPRLGVG